MSTIRAHFRELVFTISDDAGHSQALTLHNGDLTISNVVYEGAAVEDYQSAGHWTGSRLGERVFAEISISGGLSDPANAFNLLALGKTSGFVSTTVSIGDTPHVDGSAYFSYGAETRYFLFQDMNFTADFSLASPANVSFKATVKGPINDNGTVIVTAR